MRMLAGLLSLIVLASSASLASAFPNGPVKLIVGWAAGGPVDVVARLINVDLAKQLGVPVVVENRAGTNGMLATDFVLGQPRDGQTLLLCTHLDATNPVMYRTARYKAEDLQGVSQLARYYLVMATSVGNPYRTLAEFIAYAQANPGKLTYATAGIGSAQDLLMRQFVDLTKTDMQAVPFRGAAPAMIEVLAGRVDTFLSPAGTAMPMVEAGQVRLLAATSTARRPPARDVPTFGELGMPLKQYGWVGVCAGAGTPQAIVDRLNRELTTIARGTEYRSKIETSGQIPEATSPSELQGIIIGMTGEMAGLVRKYGIRASE